MGNVDRKLIRKFTIATLWQTQRRTRRDLTKEADRAARTVDLAVSFRVPRPSSFNLLHSLSPDRSARATVTLLRCSCQLRRVHDDLTVPATADRSIYGDIDKPYRSHGPASRNNDGSVGEWRSINLVGKKLSPAKLILHAAANRASHSSVQHLSRGVRVGFSLDLLELFSDMPRLTRSRGFLVYHRSISGESKASDEINLTKFSRIIVRLS